MEKANGESEICRPFTVGLSSSTARELAGSFSSAARMGGKQQPFTIFYGGKVCVCEVTEEQATAIFRFAKEEFESMEKLPPLATRYHQGLCMKRSLQRFLQERKIRATEASPYYRRRL